MRFLFPILIIVVLIISCFLPWMTIESKGITITGVDARAIDFGRPAYLHFVFIMFYSLFLLLNKVWSRRASMAFAAFNLAWALRNFLVIPICQGGECPVKRIGLYLVLIVSVAMFVAGLLVPLTERETVEN